MADQNNGVQVRSGLAKGWIFGVITGCGVAAPITAYICKRIYDNKIEQAENRAMNEMAAYAVQQQATQTEENKQEESKSDNEDGPEPTEYNVGIEEEMTYEDYKAKERTEAHQRYLDMVDKCKGDELEKPRFISAEDYIAQQFTHKTSINWYEKDNVFEENLGVIEDPLATFGVTDGHELFKDVDIRPDRDIVYIRNERLLTDFEINRIHGSYAEMVGGEASLGETDTQRGAD